MSKKITVCTISKYPPYLSGHSFEAMYQGRALYELTKKKQYEVTYDPSLYNSKVSYNDSLELLSESRRYAHVHYVTRAEEANLKVLDGVLIKAFIGKIIGLIEKKGVNVLSTYYFDPHAYIANQAKFFAKKILNKRVIAVNKAVGSDVLDSIANHLKDGEGKFLLLQLLEGDLIFTVSKYARKKLLEYAQRSLPSPVFKKFEAKTSVLYAPFDNEYFAQVNEDEQLAFKKKFRIKPNHRIISYFGRVFPEKGVKDLLLAFQGIKKKYPDTTLIIGGEGVILTEIKQLAKELNSQDTIFVGGNISAEKRALMQLSYVGVIPTKPLSNFVETLCICCLEYQAAGAPLITTHVGGVPEAAGTHSFYAKHSSPKDLEKKISIVLDNKIDRNLMIARGIEHVKKFNYLQITKQFMDKVQEKL